MQPGYWEHDSYLIEKLLESKESIKEIAKDIGVSEAKIYQRIKLLGLDWVPRNVRKVSRGQAALTQIMKKLIPGEEIVNEHHIGEQLRLDVFCPKYKLAAEYHGRQHYEFVVFFHESYDEFLRSQVRDERKIELCEENGITLVTFRYCDKLTEDYVYDRLLQALKDKATDEPTRKVAQKKLKSFVKDNPQYEQWNMRRKMHQRDLRKKIKQDRKEHHKMSFKEVDDDDDYM